MTSDKNLIKERFAANFDKYEELAHVQRRICMRLARSMATHCHGEVARALEIGAGTGFLTRCLVARWPAAKWYVNDITPAAERFLAPHLQDREVEYLWGDAEEVEFPAQLDLVASTSTAQWFEDKYAFARKSAKALNSGGYLLLSLFGPENFAEVRGAAGEGLDYPSLEEMAQIVRSAGFTLLHAEQYTETLHLDTPLDVLRYMRSIGLNAVRRTSWNRGKLAHFDTLYRQNYPSPSGGVTLTYHPLLIVAQKA